MTTATATAVTLESVADDIEVATSKNVKRFGYRHKDKALVIEFVKGGLFEYPNVPYEIFDQMRQAESVGSFLHREVKPKFEAKRLDEKKQGAEV